MFSGFYIVFMLVLLALILRAVSLDFRSKVGSPAWRRTWDVVFCFSRALATILFGLGVGNAMVGVPLTERGIYAGGFFNLLNFYSVCDGLLAVALFVMHGSIFLHLKTTGELRDRIDRWMWRAYIVSIPMYGIVTVATWFLVPRATIPFKSNPAVWFIVAVNIVAVLSIPYALRRHWSGRAFLSSCLTVTAFVLLFGIALHPNLVTPSPHPENSLTIYNAASSQKTLWIMLCVAGIGMPFVHVHYLLGISWTGWQ